MSDLSGIQYEYLPLGHDFSRPRTIGPVSIERLKQFAEVATSHPVLRTKSDIHYM
jgi:hypothetical protein